jgi:hypothetical protein
MTEPLAKLPSRRRVLFLFWMLNAMIVFALLIFALR